MIKTLKFIFTAITVTLFLSSCFEDKKAETSDYCYISSFTLGSLKRVVTVQTTEGKDSTYSYSFAGGAFPMYINHRTLTIENRDSLPHGTQLKAVIANVGFTGVLAHRAEGEGEEDWVAYNAKDSINFTTPRQFAVLSTDGLGSRIYTVKINVHQQDGDKMTWNNLGSEELPSTTERKLAILNDKLILVANINKAEGNEKKLYVRSLQADAKWAELPISGADNAVPSTLYTCGNALYMNTADGKIIQSTDAQLWTVLGEQKDGLKLVATSDDRLYAIADNTLWSTSVNGEETWKQESLDSDGNNLPDGNAQGCLLKQSTLTPNRLVIVGNHSSDPSKNIVWTKGWNKDETESAWMFYTPNAADKHPCPNMSQFNIQPYADGMIAFGSEGREYKAMSSLLYSVDTGITWKASEKDDMRIPSEIQAEATKAQSINGIVDGDNYLWLLIDNHLWRGRTNRLGFLKK